MKWMEVDSNHRSNLQQIYSLSPLATRESIHLREIYLTSTIYITSFLKLQEIFLLRSVSKMLQNNCGRRRQRNFYFSGNHRIFFRFR